MIVPLQSEIRTERLLLRPLADDDAPAIRRYAGDERVARFTANIPHPYPEDGAGHLLAIWRRKENAGTGRIFAICPADSRRDLIGMISLDENDDGTVDFGYWLGLPFWGHGPMSEAAAAIACFARTWRPASRITARTHPDNGASQRVLEKAGFARDGVGTFEAPARNGGIVENAPVFVLSPDGIDMPATAGAIA